VQSIKTTRYGGYPDTETEKVVTLRNKADPTETDDEGTEN
jgi:hypothetical protein